MRDFVGGGWPIWATPRRLRRQDPRPSPTTASSKTQIPGRGCPLGGWSILYRSDHLSKPVTWYYGHAHNGAVYLDMPGQKGSPTIRPRLSGHAAVPYTVATELTGSDQVSWLEKTYVSGTSGPIRNGFSTLTFNGSELGEQMLDQLGKVGWSTIG